MINHYKKLFRHKLSSIYLILGFSAVVIFCYNCCNMFYYIKNYREEAKVSNYKCSKEIQVSSINGFDIADYMRYFDNIVRVKNIDVYIDDADAYHPIDAIITSNEHMNYVMESGRLPGRDEKDNRERVIAVGRYYKKFCYEKDGHEYIKICGDEYRVTGVIGTKITDIQDYLLVTYYDCLSESAFKYMIDRTSYVVSLESNVLDLTYINYEYEEFIQNNPDFSVSGADTVVKSDGLSEFRTKLEGYQLIFICSVLICIVVFKFWLYEQKEENRILRIYGYSRMRIELKMFGEGIEHFLYAGIISLIFIM